MAKQAPSTRRSKIRKILGPIEDFMALESASGISLMVMAALAMVWANSPFADSYEHFIHLPLSIGIGDLTMTHSLQHWVSDGLMVIFFFVVGLEIKRELVIGELCTPKKAALPMFAALGGMVVPALVYAYFNQGKIGSSGWGIPMATDIAFAVGLLTLMGRKVPFALKVFLLALAIVDDLGAVLVIAFFYTDTILPQAMGFAVLGLGLIYVLRYAGVRSHLVYILISIVVWFFVMKSGIHATVAGVLIGLLTPLDPLYPLKELPEKFKALVNEFGEEIATMEMPRQTLSNRASHKVHDMFHYVVEAQNPLERTIHVLHPWVSFLIMPLFALVNAGVNLGGADIMSVMQHDISLGVFFGLLLGKPIGVLAFSVIAVKAKLAELPSGTTWYHVVCLGFLAGVGFTMALFISHLGLKDPDLEIYSKMGILTASLAAGAIGLFMLYFAKDQPNRNL